MPETGCKKVKFATEKDAEFYISKLKETSSRSTVPIRAYLCHCKSWHLTSKPSFSRAAEEKQLQQKTIEEQAEQIRLLNLQIQNFDNNEDRAARILSKAELQSDLSSQQYRKKIANLETEVKKLKSDRDQLIFQLNNKSNERK